MLGKTSVFLIGPMGSGKTAVGRHLSRALGLPFYDSDAEIERRTGVDIPFIFEKEGEAGFRQREREALEALTALARIVLATGGGAVLSRDNGRHLAERGWLGYLIRSGAGLIGRPDCLRQRLPGHDVLVVSNTTVAPLYLPALSATLGPRRIVEVILPDGEVHKTLATAARVLDVLIANRFGRDCALIALGGGVVGDLTGFAAACYQRGVAFAQVPTTLLAQVDSAVGGKTGVNHPGGKNLIGAFHQPALVVTDTRTLATLPARELRAGLAEVIKYGLIRDAALFGWLEAHLDELLAGAPAALAHVIRRSCEIKAAIVGRDEREVGERALLNLGHTFGHALEPATGYTQWLHGEAVGAGLP